MRNAKVKLPNIYLNQKLSSKNANVTYLNRTDLVESYCAIITPQVVVQFTENRDYRQLTDLLLTMLAQEEVLGFHGHYSIAKDHQLASLNNFHHLKSNSTKRFLSHFVAGDGEDGYFHTNSQSYISKDASVVDKNLIHSSWLEDCTVSQNSKILNSQISSGVKIGMSVFLENCYVDRNATIESGAKLRNCFIGENSIIKVNEKFIDKVILEEESFPLKKINSVEDLNEESIIDSESEEDINVTHEESSDDEATDIRLCMEDLEEIIKFTKRAEDMQREFRQTRVSYNEISMHDVITMLVRILIRKFGDQLTEKTPPIIQSLQVLEKDTTILQHLILEGISDETEKYGQNFTTAAKLFVKFYSEDLLSNEEEIISWWNEDCEHLHGDASWKSVIDQVKSSLEESSSEESSSEESSDSDS